MSEELDTDTTEDGFLVDENGEVLADPADVPTPATDTDSEGPAEEAPLEVEDEERDAEEEVEDSPAVAAGRAGEVLDFLLGAQESAALVSDILRRRITVPAFRQLVMDGHAPAPEPARDETKPGLSKWSMLALRSWAADLLEEEERAATAETGQEEAGAAPDGQEEESGTDFLLAARDAAGFLSEALGRRLSTASFRQLVIDGPAPAAAETTDGTAKWSLRTLRDWANDVLEAEAEAAAQIDPAEEAAKESSAFARWVHERVARFESWDQSTYGWCATWWEHPEAVDRFHALWLGYLSAEADGELSGWWVNHWDRHYPFLFGSEGVFSQCTGDNHQGIASRRWLENNRPPVEWLPYPERVPQKEQKES